MQKNENSVDRFVRAMLALVIFYLSFVFLSGLLAFAGYIVGIILLFTSVSGYCHLYKIMNFSTLKKDKIKNE